MRLPSFYVAVALLALVVALLGFSTTFFFPLAAGEFQAPPIVYAHGVAAFAWVLFSFSSQP